ncbi:MAG: hypothetical protein ACM3MH_09265 [Actinomycetota bacterium]
MRVLVAAVALFLVALVGPRTGAVLAGESVQQSGAHPQSGASDTDKFRGNAECPIKKTIDGKLYCFQNDPALTKRQGGD